MTTATDFVDYIPSDPVANLAWRIRMREAAARDLHLQRALKQAAFDDLLFFVAGFCMLHEPRGIVKELPFVPWPHQPPVLLGMDETITETERTGETVDFLVPKSREQGASYGYLAVILRRWLRDRRFSAGLVTRNEEDVDSKVNMGTVLAKAVFMLAMLPSWMRPEGFDFEKHRSLSEHTLWNPENGATIKGTAAVPNLFRSERLTVLAFDECGSSEWIQGEKDYAALASTAHVANTRLLVSTFGADAGAFYEAVEDKKKGKSNARMAVLDWRDNPKHTRLACVVQVDGIKPLHPEEETEARAWLKDHSKILSHLRRSGFIKEGKTISPWYVGQCLRPGATPRSIAREIDMNAKGAVGKVFEEAVLERMKKECCKPPMWRGRPVIDREESVLTGLIEDETGPLKLWFRPGVDVRDPRIAVPDGEYAIAADISAGGTGIASSNSTLCGLDMATGRQVLAYAIKGMKAHDFSRVMVAVARWMRRAFLGWEASGPGESVVEKEILGPIGYYNVYYREVNPIGGKREKKPGWSNKKESDKLDLFEAMDIAFASGLFTPRDEEMIEECGEYEIGQDGKIVHAPTRIHKGAQGAHGDRCIAAGVAWLMTKDRGSVEKSVDKDRLKAHDPPKYSPAWHMREAARFKRQQDGVAGDFPFEGIESWQ